MKKSRFSDQQIAFALQQAETGTSVADVCRKLRISEATLLPLEETLWWADALGGAQANAFCKKVKLPAKVRAIFSLARISIRSAAPERMHRERHQNAPVIGQRCTGLSPRSADWNHKFTPDPWRASSPLCAGLGFRNTQVDFCSGLFVVFTLTMPGDCAP